MDTIYFDDLVSLLLQPTFEGFSVDLIIECILLLISTILLILSVTSLVAVYMNFKFSDSTLIFSTVLITASIVFQTIVLSINVYEAALKDVQNIDIIANSLDYMKVTCLFCAFLLDLYKWLIFIIASRALNDNDEMDMNSQRTIKLWIIGSLTLQVACSITLLTMNVLTQMKELDNRDWLRIQSLVITITFGIFLFVYIAVFVILLKRLRQNYPGVFKKERSRIYTISICIVISLVARVSFNIMYSFEWI